MPIYEFGAGSFTNELWIKNKTVFTKPTLVNVEFVNAGKFLWVFADADGTEVRTVEAEAPGHWTSVHLPSLGLRKDYSIGFRNASAGERKFKQGDVTYGQATATRLRFEDTNS